MELHEFKEGIWIYDEKQNKNRLINSIMEIKGETAVFFNRCNRSSAFFESVESIVLTKSSRCRFNKTSNISIMTIKKHGNINDKLALLKTLNYEVGTMISTMAEELIKEAFKSIETQNTIL